MLRDAIFKAIPNHYKVMSMLVKKETIIDEKYDYYFLGCPASGVESLDLDEFVPFWDNLKYKIVPSPVFLFGSYSWGDKSYLTKWIDECKSLGIKVLGSYLCYEEPTIKVEQELISLIDSILK